MTWINVEKQLPPEYEFVLVYAPGDGIITSPSVETIQHIGCLCLRNLMMKIEIPEALITEWKDVLTNK